jgi:hypothetical protein
LDGSEEVVDFSEDELSATGEHRAAADYRSGSVLHVDERGRVIEED